MKFTILSSLVVLAATTPPAAAQDSPAAAAESKSAANPVVDIKTSMGTITVALNKEKAPITVDNFLKYVEKKHYDGTVFHRVISTFMIQGGGFAKDGKNLVEKETMKPIKNEAGNGLKNEAGAIAMARTQDPNSATAQFFINVKANDFLNQAVGNSGYTVFGKVTKGMDVVNQIKGVTTAVRPLVMRLPNGTTTSQPSEDVPVEDVVIESIRVSSAAAATPAPAATPAKQ